MNKQKRATNLPHVKDSKLEQIRTGNVKKSQTGGMQQKILKGKQGKKFEIIQTNQKFEESGVTKKDKTLYNIPQKQELKNPKI